MKKLFKRWKKWWKEFFEDLKIALDELDREYKVTMKFYDLTHHGHYMYPSKSPSQKLEVIDFNEVDF